MSESTAVLDLLLTARYLGAPAFRSMQNDIDGLIASSNGLTRLGHAMQTVGNVMIGAGTAVAVGLAVAVENGMKYEQALNRISAVTHMTSGQQQQLSDIVMNTAERFGQHSTDIADGAYLIMSGMQALGYTTQDVFNNNIIPALAAYVKASGDGLTGSVSFQGAANDLIHILGGMHVPIDQWADAMGNLTAVENTAGVTQQQLVSGMLRFAPTASVLKMSFAETAATVGALATAGVPGARAGTELSAGFRQMIATASGQQELRHLGLDPNTFFQNGQLVDINTIMQMVLPRIAQQGGPAQQLMAMTKLFGAAGSRAMLELGNQNTLAIYNRLLGKETGSAGMMQVATALSQNSLMGHVEILMAALGNLADVLEQKLKPALLPIIDRLTAFAEGLRRVLEKMSPQQVASLVTTGLTGLIGGGLALKGAGGILEHLGLEHANVTAHNKREMEKLLENEDYSPELKTSAVMKMQQAIGQFIGGGAGLGRNVFDRVGAGFEFFRSGEFNGDKAVADFVETQRTGVLKQLAMHFPQFMESRQGLPREFLGLLTTPIKDTVTGRFMAGGGKKITEEMVQASPLASLKALGADIVGGTGDLFGGIVKSAGALITMLPEMAGGFLAIAGPVLLVAGAVAIVVLAFTRFHDQTMQAIQAIGNQLAPIFQFFGSLVQTVWAQIQAAWDRAQPSIDKAMDAFLKNLPRITPLLEVFGAIFGAVVAIILAAITGLVNGFLQALPPIINFFSAIFTVLGDVGQLIIDLVTFQWGKIPGLVGDIFVNLWNVIVAAAQAIWNFLAGFVQGIVGFFQGLWDMVSGVSDKGSAKTKDAAVKNLTMMKDQSKGILDKMGLDASTSVNGMSTNMNDTLSTMAENGCGAFADMQNCATTHTDQMAQQVQSKVHLLPDAISKDLAAITAAGNQMGSGLINGVIAGINAGMYQAQVASTNAANTVSTAFAKHLQISSPSRVFFGHGENIVRGLILGIQSLQGNVQGAWTGVGAPSTPGGRAPTNTYRDTLMVQAYRESRTSDRQAITRPTLLDEFDMQYRYGYQRTA